MDVTEFVEINWSRAPVFLDKELRQVTPRPPSPQFWG